MRRGGRQRRAPALPLISLLQASSTHGARLKRKGTQNKFYNVTPWEAAVPVEGGGVEMITAFVFSKTCVEVNWQATLVVLKPQLLGGDRRGGLLPAII